MNNLQMISNQMLYTLLNSERGLRPDNTFKNFWDFSTLNGHKFSNKANWEKTS